MGDRTDSLLQEQLKRSFAENGMELLDNTNLSTTTPFNGFIVGDSGVTISVLTIDPNNVGGNYVTFPYSAGAWYPISGTAMTITAGNILLIR